MPKTIYKDPARFYVYAFLREDGTPYYIGKGHGNRAWKKRRRNSPPADSSKIAILKGSLTETEAFDEEIRLIKLHGRKDLRTGILRNLTDGGEGMTNPSVETRAKQSESSTGRYHTPESIAKMSGENHHNFGKNRTPETRAKISEALSGRKQSPETIAKNSGENNPNFGKKRSPESIAKGIATRKRNAEAKDLLALVEQV